MKRRAFVRASCSLAAIGSLLPAKLFAQQQLLAVYELPFKAVHIRHGLLTGFNQPISIAEMPKLQALGHQRFHRNHLDAEEDYMDYFSLKINNQHLGLARHADSWMLSSSAKKSNKISLAHEELFEGLQIKVFGLEAGESYQFNKSVFCWPLQGELRASGMPINQQYAALLNGQVYAHSAAVLLVLEG